MKNFILLLLFFSFASTILAETEATRDSFYVKYIGTALQGADTMIFYSKQDKFKYVEHFKIGGIPAVKTTYLIGQEMIIINDDGGLKNGISVPIQQTHDEFIDGIYFLSKQNYQEFSNPAGTDNYLGYPCSVFENHEGNKIWVYKDTYVLKVMNVVDNTETYALEFQLNPVLDDKIFEIPADAVIQSY